MSRDVDVAQGLGDASVGSAFRSAREGAGLTVRATASAAGISHATLSRWERGQRDIAQETYERLSRALAKHLSGRWVA